MLEAIDMMAAEAARVICKLKQVTRIQRALLIISACANAVLLALLLA